MSGATAAATGATTGAVKGAVKAADDSVGHWLKGIVTGEGNSPSQIIVSGILGVVPGLGQAMDLRDIVVGVITIASAPGNPMAWLDMAITLVGCIPAAGDALKTTFRLLKRGDSLPRILDGLSPAIRGNVERFFRDIDWGQVARTVKGTFDKVLGAFIDGLDSWVVKTMMGRGEVKLLIEQLTQMRKQAPKMLDEAIGELKAMWNKALGDKLPTSTAHGTPAKASAPSSSSGGGGRAPEVDPKAPPKTVQRDRSDKPTTTPDTPRTEQRRAAKKKQGFETGVPAEHMTDYWVARTKRNLKKANNGGRLWEETDRPGRQGIDHVWMQRGNSDRPGVIGETKSSLLGAFKFLAALPEDIRAQLSALSADEASKPTAATAGSEKPTPNIFDSKERDSVTSRAKIDGSAEAEAELKKGLGDTKTKGVQMSHLWIYKSLPDERMTPQGQELNRHVKRYWKTLLMDETSTPPYARWITMVTGRQKALHERKQGHQHQIQPPLIPLPDGVLAK
ncbi:hypothetical protein HLB44_20855 [Aquincola sp. S2]|uniref:Uncharacterized protein n=1 Tax=Pseudaquabacterium terrae TaxID=2732868 RepID=A0ABX2ELF0_9BURK|nr:hypothetical protein [Aquabacterium terrae]NRF69455.1 hypothetical protein [Aquabacterium terrae]